MKLTPGKLTLDQLESIYFGEEKISLDNNCRDAVEKSREVVVATVTGEDPVYGVNTGFGKLASTRIEAEQGVALQRNLILSHCCGMGEKLPDNIVRLIMILKLACLGCGASGVRWQLIEHLQGMIENNILPVIPAKGSVGASGDLAPLAHLTAGMIGEGSVIHNGKEVSAANALQDIGIDPLVLESKEGLAMINGTQVSTTLALAGLFDAWRNCNSALITGAISVDAFMASTVPFRPEIHQLRPHRGQIDSAATLYGLLEGSEIRESHHQDDERVQDPYCLRCQPQVMGACMDQLRHAGQTLEIESNSVTDNPLVISENGSIYSGGNFHAEPVAFAADQIAMAVTEIGSITQRRIAIMVDPALNYGLPAFLTPDPGLNSGFMVADIVAAALMSENKQKASLCSIDSTPTSANQEDHVSMACHGAYRLLEMNMNLARIIAIELVIATQGVEFRLPLKTSKSLLKVTALVRKNIKALEADRYMANDLKIAANLVANGKVTDVIGKGVLPNVKNRFA